MRHENDRKKKKHRAHNTTTSIIKNIHEEPKVDRAEGSTDITLSRCYIFDAMVS